MGLFSLTTILLAMCAIRIAFLAFNFSNLENLWYDYERRGGKFQFARLLDYATLGVFLICAAWTVWKQEVHDSSWLGKVFVAWLGWLLLERLPVHRFPRTNRPGAYEAGKINLIVNLLLAVSGAMVVTAIAWMYARWRG